MARLNRRRFLRAASGLFVPAWFGITQAQDMILSGPVMRTMSPTGYTSYAAIFDGTNDWMERDADLGEVDGKKGIVSFWFKPTNGDGADVYIIQNSGTRVWIGKNTSNLMIVIIKNTSNVIAVSLATQTAVLEGSGWHHLIASWNTETPAAYMYLDGASDLTTVTLTTNDTLDYTRADWAIGAVIGGSAKFTGELCEVYFNFEEAIDLSVEANRLAFRSSAGKPVSLGTDGSAPTTHQPALYLRSPYDSFTTNSGSGGNFTMTGGSLTEGTPP